VDTKDFIDLADNPDFISGIYNYCDRWCERCPLTARCLVYATEKEDEDDNPENRDIRNAAFWQKLGSIFKQTQELITAWAEENGVDLSTVAVESAIEEERRQMDDAHSDELASAAESYAWQVNQWFEEVLGMETSDDSGGATTGPDDEEGNVRDATEVIRWYQFQITAKIVRALMSRGDEKADEETMEETLLRDSDGSIKVSLIAIDRSISAWRFMQLSFPDQADTIVPLLLALERLRQNTEKAFPNARDFIRPGFDEISGDLIH
jgi:hypothetical protein